jgi:hypothetical protein
MKLSKSQNGYTLLFAVLTAALALAVAAFIAGVARKQYILSSTARDSIFALYNADSAVSCITGSWDYASGTPQGASIPPNMSCNGSAVTTNTFSSVSSASWPVDSTFNDSYPVYESAYDSTNNTISFDSNGGCARFSIWVGYNSSNEEKRVIEARGYNICVNGAPSSDAHTVERAIRLTQ